MRANIQLANSKPEGAVAEAVALVKAAPNTGYAHVAAARIYQSVGRQEDALAEFDRALAIKPAAYIYLNRIDSRAKDDRAGRMADLAAALNLEPKSPSVLAAKAGLLVEDGKFAEAISIYDAQLAEAPNDSKLLMLRGFAKIRAGNSKGSAVDLAAAAAQLKTPDQLNNSCWMKAVAGLALESALEDCNRALNLSPRNAGYLDSKGLVQLRLGRTDDAISTYSEALALRQFPGSYYGRGIAWRRKGDKVRADADIAAARNIDARVPAEFAGYGVTS